MDMKKICLLLTVCLSLVWGAKAQQYAPWEPSQGPLDFITLTAPYVKCATGSSPTSYNSSPGIHSYGGNVTHQILTTQAVDPCRCYQISGNTYQQESVLPPSWNGTPNENLEAVIRMGCSACNNGASSCACSRNSEIEYWFYPQEDESTLLVYFTFAEDDITYHACDVNPRFYIEVLDGQTNQLLQLGYYKNQNGQIMTNKPYSRFCAVPSGSNASSDYSLVLPENQSYGITTYYWAFSETTPTNFPFKECPKSQIGNQADVDGNYVKWFEYKPLAFDLSAQAAQGRSVKLRIRVRSCDYNTHWAYCMFAAKMIPGNIKVDACGTEPVTLSVPWGFDERIYNWYCGYDSASAGVLDFESTPGISGDYKTVVIDRNTVPVLYPYYRCEMRSYTGVPFIYEAHIQSYFLEPDFDFEQQFNNCNLTVQFHDQSEIMAISPPSIPVSQGGTPDTVYQEDQHIQWFVKRYNNFVPFGTVGETNPIYTFDSTTISADGLATIRIVIQDEEQKCIDTLERTIQLDLSAVEKSMATDTVVTCEEKLPYVYDQAYFGDTQTWSTEGTRRVNYESLAWNGCDSLVDVTLIVRKPKVEVVFDLDYCDEFSTTLSAATEEEVAEYKWSTGETTPTITITAPGTYAVDIINTDGCEASNSITIPACKPYLNLPNTITPSNIDGVNDYFYIPQRNLIQSLEFTVFNRNGEVVYHTTNKDFEWNGTENGKLMVGTIYSYTLRIVDYEGVASTHKGSITIL